MYTLVDQLEILYITNLEWCLQQLAFAVVDVVHCILEQKERLQMLHSFLEIFSKGKNFPVPDTYVKGREFRPKASKARFNIVGRNPTGRRNGLLAASLRCYIHHRQHATKPLPSWLRFFYFYILYFCFL